jgi:3-dehydroquinate dehydratase
MAKRNIFILKLIAAGATGIAIGFGLHSYELSIMERREVEKNISEDQMLS